MHAPREALQSNMQIRVSPLASIKPFHRSLQQFLNRFDVARGEWFGAIVTTIEGTPHFIREFFRKGEGQIHAVVVTIVEEQVQVALEGVAVFLHVKGVLGLAVFHYPQLKNVHRFA
jgi:hypothetical protein